MSDKIIDIGGHLEKRDLDLILEVNKKAIEIHSEVAAQNEEEIELLGHVVANQEKIIKQNEKIIEQNERIIKQNEKIIEQNEKIDKDLFKTKVVFVTGILALIAQIVQIFLRK
jgi:3-oxoacyl-ACP reductase-like protein